MNAFTVRADPSGAVTDTPCILRKAVRTDSETAGAGPAKRKFSFTAMTDIFLFSPATTYFLRGTVHDSFE